MRKRPLVFRLKERCIPHTGVANPLSTYPPISRVVCRLNAPQPVPLATCVTCVVFRQTYKLLFPFPHIPTRDQAAAAARKPPLKKGVPGILQKVDQRILPEAPLFSKSDDCLNFDDYADVLSDRVRDPRVWPVGVGIYAQWGAGKVSHDLILHRHRIG